MKARVLEGFLDVRHHIQARIFMCLIGVSLVSCMTFSVFWYSTNLKNAHDTIAEGNASSLYNVSELLDNVIESAAMNHVALLNDTTVQRHIESGNDTAPDLRWFEYYNYTLTFIKRYVTSKNNYVLGIRMILPDDSVCSFGSFTSNIESYPSMPLNQDLLYFEQGALYLARKVRSEGNGYVTILTEFAPSLFPQMFSGLTDDGATLYVYLNQSQLVRKLPAHAPDLPVQELELSNSPAKGTFTTFVNDHLMCRVDSSTYGLMYIYTVPMMKLRGSIGSIVYQLVTPCIIILLGVLIISILLSKSVTRGLVALSRNISRAATGDFSSLEMIHSEDEVGRLGQSFVDMTIQIDGLIKEINENEMDRHRMEMQVLRAQVSPHFLCNTLNSITYLASMQNIENIRQLSASLNELLQSALYIDDTLISLTEELDYVQHYFNILRVQGKKVSRGKRMKRIIKRRDLGVNYSHNA